MIGVLGGMGPAATADFLSKLVALTPARRDQDHLPVLVANLPHVPDRTAAILGHGPDPFPALQRGLALLNDAGAKLIAVPCNTAHHWYDDLVRVSRAPLLHIADAALAALPSGTGLAVALLATRGTLAAGFYQRELLDKGHRVLLPDGPTQAWLDDCIAGVKRGDVDAAAASLRQALDTMQSRGAAHAILGCTELPVAAAALGTQLPLPCVDTSLELARKAVRHAVALGWNRAEPLIPDNALRPVPRRGVESVPQRPRAALATPQKDPLNR